MDPSGSQWIPMEFKWIPMDPRLFQVIQIDPNIYHNYSQINQIYSNGFRLSGLPRILVHAILLGH